HGEITGEAVRRLTDDATDAIAGDALQHGREAGTLRNRVCALHSPVVVPVDDDEAVGLGVGLDRSSLALVAVLVPPDIGRGRGAHIADRFEQFSLACHDLSLDLYCYPEETVQIES